MAIILLWLRSCCILLYVGKTRVLLKSNGGTRQTYGSFDESASGSFSDVRNAVEEVIVIASR